MAEHSAIATLQHSLSETRSARRQTQTRLTEIEEEASALRGQLRSLDMIIEQTELALRRALFPPDERAIEPAPQRTVTFEEEVASHRLGEQSGNVRFTDFRIPQAATVVLREAHEPLHVSEIYRRMSEGGFEFRGQHQLITLAVSLSRSKRFRKVAPGTFELDPKFATGQVA
jgi:hypothetical protein